MTYSRKITAVILAVVTLFSIMALSVNASADYTDVKNKSAIISSAVDVRKEATVKSDKVMHLYEHDFVKVIDSVTKDSVTWYNISANGKTGFIPKTAADVIFDIGMSTATVNVRKLPSTLLGERVTGVKEFDGFYIHEKVSNAEGDWYRITVRTTILITVYLSGYIKAEYVELMKLPASGEYNAKYNESVKLNITARNVPKNIVMTVDKTTIPSTGKYEFTNAVDLGQMKESREINVAFTDSAGNVMGNSVVKINVDSSFIAKISAFFSFLFSGFNWGSKTIDVK
jgi:hypothetical protein